MQGYTIHQLLHAAGWSLVWAQADGTHVTEPCAGLALVTKQFQNRGAPEQTIVPLAFEGKGQEFFVPSELDNYCGLLPPWRTLEAFLATRGCQHGQETTP